MRLSMSEHTSLLILSFVFGASFAVALIFPAMRALSDRNWGREFRAREHAIIELLVGAATRVAQENTLSKEQRREQVLSLRREVLDAAAEREAPESPEALAEARARHDDALQKLIAFALSIVGEDAGQDINEAGEAGERKVP